MAASRVQLVYDSQLLGSSTNSIPATPRRTTVAAFPGGQQAYIARYQKANSNQCTHLTMTRLYSDEYRCCICLRLGSMGWIYRCTQDRELLLEDDMERGDVEKLDKFCDIFERPSTPRKRGPVARLSSMSFFDENSDEALESYSATQLSTILKQRAHARDVASKSDSSFSPDPPFPRLVNPLLPSPDIIPSPPKTPKDTKPWLTPKGGECQFKVCQFCRPTCEVRSYLSLNGIANNDIPSTAITGFGFNLTKKRPVALVKHVKNLGLRKNPSPRRDGILRILRPLNPAKSNLPLGLGILSNAELVYRTKPLPELPTAAPTKKLPHIATYSPAAHRAIDENGLFHQPPHMIPLPEQSLEEIAMISAPLTPMEELELDKGVFGSAPLEVDGGVAMMEESVDFRVADVVTQF